MTTDTKQIPNDTEDGEEELGMPTWLESPHLAFLKPNGLVRDFGQVVGPAARVVRNRGQYLTVGRTVAPKLVGDEPTWPIALRFQELTEEAFSCSSVPLGLDQDIDGVAVLIYSPPQILHLALDLDEHFVEMPVVAKASLLLPQSPGVFEAKPLAPLPNCLVGYNDAAFSEYVFDIALSFAKTRSGSLLV